MAVEDYVKETDGKINVDWDALARFKRRADGNNTLSLFNSVFDDVLEYLLEKDILTYSSDSSFTLSWRGFCLDPKLSSGPYSPLNFTREQDARAYARGFYEYLHDGVNLGRRTEDGLIEKIDTGINKE